jgi:hypothetical protein
MDGKPQSKTKWEKPEREAETNRRADTERERDVWEPQSKTEWKKIAK